MAGYTILICGVDQNSKMAAIAGQTQQDPMGEYFQITCVFLSETTEPLVSKFQLKCVLNGHVQNVCFWLIKNPRCGLP